MSENEERELRQKALDVNLDNHIYGTFAEIGAGQEVARNFFQAGGASGTIAKTMSAYDMTFSDSIYGKERSGRYVCEPRLMHMLDKEYGLLQERLKAKRGRETLFFVYANTVSAINFKKSNMAHGWMGVRFQMSPGGVPNDVVVHVRMHDRDNIMQQKAIGIVGVNLIHSCFFVRDRRKRLVKSLMDGLDSDRIEIDMIRCSGPAFRNVDNRLLSLQLVTNRFTQAVLFDDRGNVVQPSEFLYKKDIVSIRGSYNPPTLVNMDLMETSYKKFLEDEKVEEDRSILLTEITMDKLSNEGQLSEKNFLGRVELLNVLNQNVLISNFDEYYQLAAYYNNVTRGRVGMAIGVREIEILCEYYFEKDNPGVVLHALSQFVQGNVVVYLYPLTKEVDEKKVTVTSKNIHLHEMLRPVFDFLVKTGRIQDIENVNQELHGIYSRTILRMIKDGEPGWEKMVPSEIIDWVKVWIK